MPAFRSPILVSLIVLVAGLLIACSDDGRSARAGDLRVEIGVVQSLSGAADVYGKSVAQGIDLAVAEINGAGEGVTMTILLMDDESSVEAGRAAFESLVEREVTAIIGPTLSNIALEAMTTAQDGGIPVLASTTTAAGIPEIGDYVFRIALPESVVVPVTVERVHGRMPIARAVLVLDSQDAFSRSSADAMRSGIEAIGAEIVTEIDVSTADLTQALLLDFQAIDAFLVTPLIEVSTIVVTGLRQSGFEGAIIGGNSFNTPGIATSAGEAVDGAYVGAAWNPGVGNAASRRFVAEYTEKYGEAPDLFAAQGYSSVYVLLDATKRAGSTEGRALRDAIAATQGLETPLGSITITPQREAVHAPVVQQFQDGRLIVIP